MGYTHYYYVSSYYEQEAWDALLKDVKKLLELPIPTPLLSALPLPPAYKNTDYTFGDLINREEVIDGNQGHYKINKTQISFNGIGEMAHEQFQLYQRMPPEVFERKEEFAKRFAVPSGISATTADRVRETGISGMHHPYFDCTKTAVKPYDIVVCCCLILAKKHLGDGIAVSSDGGESDWADAINLIEKNFGYKVKTRWSRDEGEIFSKVK